MNHPRRPRRWSLPLALTAGLLACNPGKSDGVTVDANGQPAVAQRPLEPLPELRVGTRQVVEGKALTGTAAATMRDATHQYLELELPLSGDDMSLEFDQSHVELTGAAPGDLAVVAERMGGTEARVLVRRAIRSEAPGGMSGALYAERWAEGGREWVRVSFSVADMAGARDDKQLKTRWVEAFAAQFGKSWRVPAHPWNSFAAGRVRALLPEGFKAGAADGFTNRAPRTDLSQLMDTTTGVMSMQEALQHDRGLRMGRGEVAARTIPVAELAGPPLDAHPFPAMQAKLAQPDGGTAEPLASSVPAEFWYARFDDIRMMLRVLDEADAWLTPIVQILQSNPEDRHLSARYQAQLGLRRTGMAKLFGHTVVGQVALAGSDPYVREGSDITMLFSLKQQAVFDAELAEHLEAYKAEVPGLASATRDYHGVTITESRDPTGTVRQQRAQVGEVALVSNSPRAIERVLDAMQRRTARLGDEADLKYMLARDPGAHPAFAFLSDKFIGAVVGPQQKLQAARRQQALADLLTPGYAALLHGWLFGQAPASSEALIASGLLAAEELKHPDGAAIEFAPGRGASSTWGRPSALTPLIDLPPVTLVSEVERGAYQNFVTGYQQYWRQFIDPVAIRLDVDDAGGAAKATLDVRILPLISATDYSEIERIVGGTRAEVALIDEGLQAVWAVGKEARLRGDLDGLMRGLSGKSEINVGWLGDWVMLGVDDRATLVELLSKFDDKVQLAPPKPKGREFDDIDLWRRVGKFPMYAAAEVKNPAMMVATLAAIRATIDGVAPGWVEWGELKKYRDLPIVRVGMSKTMPMLPNREIADAVALHYVQTGQAIALSLDLPTLERVADRMLDGKLPKAGEQGAAQFVFEGRSVVGAPLWTSLLWAIQGQANEAQASARRSAEILLRGDPSVQSDPKAFAQLGVNYLGFTPVTAHGTTAFTLGPAGAGDPVLGSTIAPSFVPLPIPGSPVEALMQRLTGVRGEVSFDKEPDPAGPNARSLHTRFIVQLGAAP